MRHSRETTRIEARHAYLLALADLIRPLTDPVAIQQAACRLLGEHLDVDWVQYSELDLARGLLINTHDYYRDTRQRDALSRHVGECDLNAFPAHTNAWRAGRSLSVHEVGSEPALSAGERASLLQHAVQACITTPLLKDGVPVAVMAALSAVPRRWTTDDEALLRETANRIGDSVERALRHDENRLRLALLAAQMGTWHWEVAADRHGRDANLNRLLGLDARETVLPLEQFITHVHADDRDRVRTAFAISVRQGHSLQVDFRVVRSDGRLVWLRGQGDVFGSGVDCYLAGACVDITDRKQLEDRLREADRRKDEFLAMLGHELRNPLAPLNNAMIAMRQRGLDAESLGKAQGMMERQVGHLSRLVNDLLDMSRITLGLIELRRESLDLAVVAEQALEMALPAIKDQGHELTLALPQGPLRVHGDAARLTQVFFNLLNNASKYTPAGGRIWLSLGREDGQAVVRVRDNGSGMTSELVPQVFELFKQGAHTLDRSQGGLGLGLTLVRRLVEMHGGSVAASSDGPGRGSEFVVRFPLQVAPPVPASADDPAPSPPAAQAITALVVDDVADIADSCAWLLEGLVGQVEVAYSGTQAIEKATRRPPQLVVCDLGMPGMDGYETCRQLRQLPGMQTAFIVAVSGYGGEQHIRASREAGFDRHLVKPIGGETLESLILDVVERQRSIP